MEDDEEIMTHHSGDSESPPPPPPPRSAGRIAVTVASAPPSHNVLALALPVEQPRSANTHNSGGGREDCWSEGATGVLIDAWGERYMELSRGNLKQKHWKEVADIVSSREDYMKTPKTDIQCKNRIDTVKKKYKTEKQKIASGCGPSRWPFFNRLDELIGHTSKINPGRAGPSVSPVTVGYSGSKNVPMGIPVGIRPIPMATIPPIPQFRQPVNFQSHLNSNSYQNPNKRKAQVEEYSDTDESEPEPEYSRDSSDGFPPEPKRGRFNANGSRGIKNGKEKEKEKRWGNSIRELTRAIMSFGESYERAESSKLEQLMEMEKERMRFAKEMELQRIQFFMKTQMDYLQVKKQNRVENNNSDSSS